MTEPSEAEKTFNALLIEWGFGDGYFQDDDERKRVQGTMAAWRADRGLKEE